MLNYEEFKAYVEENIGGYLPVKYNGTHTLEVVKLPRGIDIVMLKANNLEENDPMSDPFLGLSLQEVYEKYVSSVTENKLQALIQCVSMLVFNYEVDTFDGDSLENLMDDIVSNKDHFMHHIFPCLLNEELIDADMVTRNYKDMTVAFRCVINIEGSDSVYHMDIKKSILKELDITEDEVWEAGINNIESIFNNLIGEISMDGRLEPECGVYIFTNDKEYMGCNGILNNNILADYANQLGSDLLLFPTHSDGCFCVLADNMPFSDHSELKEHIMSISDVMIGDNENKKLPYGMYRYSRETSTLVKFPNLTLVK